MKIVVLVKEVPDTYEDRKLDLETGLADRDASESVLDEISERAVEVALQFADTHSDTEVVLLSMAPENAVASIRKGLAMGAHSAVHIADGELIGSDTVLTAQVLAAGLNTIGFDLVICGNQSTDGSTGVLPAMLSELLEVPSATALTQVDISETAVTGSCAADGAVVQLSASLPAVISITDSLSDPRFPSFKGIMAAKKKPIQTLTLGDIGVNPADPDFARSIVIGISERPPRAAGIKIIDEGDAAEQLANFLVQNRLA